MPVRLTAHAVEKSTYVITAAFYDEDGNAVIPNAGLKWSLTDKHGGAVNNRTDVALTPASSVTIILKGDDLAVSDSGRTRILKIEGDYDSSLGAGLPIKESAEFIIDDIENVT